jgi:P-type Cu+ transporter
MKMWKWALAGMLYVTVVVVGFQGYNKWFADEKETVQADMQDMGKMDDKKTKDGKDSMANMEDMGNTEHNEEATETGSHEEEGSHGHGEDSSHSDGSQVNAFVYNDQNNIVITLKDKAGNPIDNLEVNHEKILHLIIVDEQLQKYYHLHPDRTGNGEFTIGNPLPEGYYKAFIDIKPTSHSYEVEPVPFVVGSPKTEGHGHALVPDTTFTRIVDDKEVTMNVSSFKAGDTVKLTFDLDRTNLTPYLGAMGHVVILDEYGKKFLHVHPSNDTDTIFETTFDKPGVYKIWAEFQQDGKVRAFPFVIEVTE